MKRLALLLVLVTPERLVHFSAGDYLIEELRSEDATMTPPFSVSDVIPFNGGLRLFLSTDRPAAVAGLLSGDSLEAQLSDHESETASPVSLSLGKAVWCGKNIDPLYSAYADPLPSCNGEPPARIEYFFEVAVILGPGRDLAIGLDPDFLWLIEKR